jgi:hypothetical protein
MKWYIIKNESPFVLTNPSPKVLGIGGWGNGYVAIPPGHCLYELSYDEVYWKMGDILSVHGGITYSNFGDGVNAPKNWWVFGFDTCHYNDSLDKWPESAVIEETKSFFWQLVKIEWGEL